jgi:argininosuccinate synthase
MADSKPKKTVKKVVLAYSGGLDTSIILKWLQAIYGCEVVTFTADLGQGEELEPARQKALLLGIKKESIFVEDLREEFVRDFVFPMFRANALYEGQYLLGTSIARPLIAKKQIEIAEKVGADAVAHGATGKGNDQVRFELTYYALKPDVTVIAPWREWDLTSRSKLIEFAEKHQIPIAKDKRGEAPFSVRRQPLAYILGREGSGRSRQDVPITNSPARSILRRRPTNQPPSLSIFERGDCGIAVGRQRKFAGPFCSSTSMNLRRANGIGRLDSGTINRFVGMKSRGMYEDSGRHDIAPPSQFVESNRSQLDRGAAQLK